VAADVVRMLYPAGSRAKVPVVAVLENAETVGMLDALVAAAVDAGRRPGVVCGSRSGAGEGGREVRLASASAVAWDDRIDMAVISVPGATVQRRGLGLERVDLAILPGSEASSKAGAALARVARGRVALADAPETLGAALEVLGLPRHGAVPLESGTAPAAPLEPRRPVRADRFSVLLVGDIGFGESYLEHPRAAALRAMLETHGRDRCFAQLGGLLGSADMVIGNLEAPLSRQLDASLGDHKKYLSWSDPEASALALREAGVQAVGLANNHMLDCGTAGLAETLSALDRRGIASFGAGNDLASAERPLIVPFTVGSVERSLVVFAGFEHRRRYERQFRWYARRSSPGVCELSPRRIATEIARLRDQLPAPTFLAYPHWGTDYAEVTNAQRSYAAALVDAGVELVIGHGAHVAQAVETVGGRPVIYGLGNFVWNTPGRFEKQKAKPLGLAAALEFAAGGPSRLRLYPLLTDNGITGFKTRLVTDQEFADAARGIRIECKPRPRRGTDGVGPHLEIDLTPPRQAVRQAGALDLMRTGLRGAREPAAVPNGVVSLEPQQ
jgi:cyanophycin synthetase